MSIRQTPNFTNSNETDPLSLHLDQTTPQTVGGTPVFTTPNLGTPSVLVGTNITGTASGLTAGNVTTNANLTGDVTSVGNATSLIDWTLGNVTYVPIGGSIGTYITNATAGDTLILASGTYTLTSSITVSKALTIVGQGIDSTIVTTSTNNVVPFAVTADNVHIKDFTVSSTGGGSSVYLINFAGQSGSVFTNCRITNVKATYSGSVTTMLAIVYNDAGGIVRNLTVDTVTSGATNYGILHQHSASAEATTTLRVYNTRVSVSSATTAYAYLINDVSATEDLIDYIYDSHITASGATTSRGLAALNGDAFVYATNSYFSGTTQDVYNSGTMQLTSCTIGNNLTFGTITFDGNLVTENLIANAATVSGVSGLDGATPVTATIHSTNNGTWTDEAIPAQLIFSTADGTPGVRSAIKLYADDTAGFDNGLSFWTTTAGAAGITEQMRLNHIGNLSLGTTTDGYKLTVAGSWSLVGSDVFTDDTQKNMRIGFPHYDNGTYTLPVTIMYNTATLADNVVIFGGGTSGGYAATRVDFVTAANNTTTTGTTRMQILSSGIVTTSAQMGVMTTNPLRGLDVNEASGNCLRLIYNDANGSATYYSDFLVSSAGNLTINASGGSISLGDENLTTTGAVRGTFTSNDGSAGATGTFTSADAKTVTVKDGIIVSIV